TINDTLETACTAATLRCRIAPAVTGNSLTSSRTSSSGDPAATPSAPSGTLDGAAGRSATACARGAVPSAAPAPDGPSTGCQQENRCAWVSPVSGGSSVRHRSVARLQRGANRHPGGGSDRAGGSAPMLSSRWLLSWSSRGIDASRACVYG